MLRRNECRLNFKNRPVRTGDIKGGVLNNPPLPLIEVARSLPLIGLTFALLGGVFERVPDKISKSKISNRKISNAKYRKQNIEIAKYRNRRISKSQNIESQNVEYAKYRNRKISYRKISNGKISNTQNIDGQNIECKISNAKYRTQNIEVT